MLGCLQKVKLRTKPKYAVHIIIEVNAQICGSFLFLLLLVVKEMIVQDIQDSRP